MKPKYTYTVTVGPVVHRGIIATSVCNAVAQVRRSLLKMAGDLPMLGPKQKKARAGAINQIRQFFLRETDGGWRGVNVSVEGVAARKAA